MSIPSRAPGGFPVAVTGLGAVTPFGIGREALWQGLLSGEDAFGRITLFDPSAHRTEVGCEVPQLPETAPRRIQADLLSRVDCFGLAAAREALEQAGLLDHETGGSLSGDRTGLIGATASGNILGLETFFRQRFAGTETENARLLLNSFCLSSLTDNLAAELLISGPRQTLATVCSSSGLALAAAFEILNSGRADRVLVVGAETLCQVTHAGFNNLRSVAPDCCRPFDVSRQGLILGEGAGALLLENQESLHERGATAMAWLLGYGLATDSHHFTAPDPSGEAVAAVVQETLTRSGLQAMDIDYVNAHGTGTQLNDRAEMLGLNLAFGHGADHVALSSCKSMIGHLLGAASIVEAIGTILALERDAAPPSANLQQPELENGCQILTEPALGRGLDLALSNSFAFGGSNISLAFSRTEKAVARSRPQPVLDSAPAVTGVGLVSPFGLGRKPFRQGLEQGRSGLSLLSPFGEAWSSLSGGLVDTDLVREAVPASRRRHLNRQGMFLSLAIEEAMEQAGLRAGELGSAQMAYGSAFGCSGSVHEFYTQILAKGPKLALPQHFMLSVTNAPAALAAQSLGLKGPVWVFVSGEVSFETALHWACDLIQAGRTDRALVCAAEELNTSILDIHKALGFFSRPHQPGFTLGEGAVCLILEKAGAAARRGASILGEVTAWHSVQDCSCGPQTYASQPDGLLEAAAACLVGSANQPERLACFAPDNGIVAPGGLPERLAGIVADRVEISQWRALRRDLGDSGLAGGFGIASALLPEIWPALTGGLVLSSSRGGLQAATRLSRNRSQS